MTKGCKKFQEMLQMDLASSTPSDFILRFCSKLNLDKDIKDLCMHVVKKADEMSIICANTPPSIAAGCIYLVCTVCKIPIDKKELAKATEVSQVTIAKCFKILHLYRSYLIPEDTLASYESS
jgi:transcription initiation factor TFIIB